MYECRSVQAYMRAAAHQPSSVLWASGATAVQLYTRIRALVSLILTEDAALVLV